MAELKPSKVKSSNAIRQNLAKTLRLDLVGPLPESTEYQTEILPQAPSQWYLTGFLVPYEAAIEERSDDIGSDNPDILDRVSPGDDENTPEAASARQAPFPSSMGLSFLLGTTTKEIQVAVSWGDYERITIDKSNTDSLIVRHPEGLVENQGETQIQPQEDQQSELTYNPDTDSPEDLDSHEGDGRANRATFNWKRIPHSALITVELDKAKPDKSRLIKKEIEVPDSGGLKLVILTRSVSAGVPVPAGTCSVSVFLVNYRPPSDEGVRDLSFAFQTELTIACEEGFIPRANPRGQGGDEWDERVAELQYRDALEYAVGHNVSALASTEIHGECHRVGTIWLPTSEVEKVVPADISDVTLQIETLAEAENFGQLRSMLWPMVTEYEEWIDNQHSDLPSEPQRREVAEELIDRARNACRRIAEGIEVLQDPLVMIAFKIANRAIATSIRQRLSHNTDKLPEDFDPPTWRPFQLAFVLMNLVGIAHPEHADRGLVDLLFFPTGGGKTEAYLGLSAFTLVLRRLRNPGIQSAGLSILMRYTLRLLTLDQLGRAATLVCALELERQKDKALLGEWPFEIGLWVGQTATPNRMGKKGDNNSFSARERTRAYQQSPDRKPSPIPLENCPWCGDRFTPNSFQLMPNPEEPKNLRVMCINSKRHPQTKKYICAFRSDNPLPLIAVDEPIYRRLPCFMIATVDKFANLPWVGQTGALFGRVERHDQDGFYGPATPGIGKPLAGALPPPDLIIQDELHLISGPLGTMVGLYETAIDALATSDGEHGKMIRPKIIASTATVRRASRQIQALFGRSGVEIFPPPGSDRRDSFFAKTVSVSERHGRLYLGVAAQGRSLKVVLLRVYLALIGAATKEWKEAGGKRVKNNPADPYMTLLGYFNALRELGGSRRIVEDEVKSRLTWYSHRKRIGEEEGLFANREIADEVSELTSRVSTNQIADAKRRLNLGFDSDEAIDVALATNMISVGLDIVRLGLMVVLGQPKTSSEYIQATSRVGRDDKRPGLVVTLMNVHRPRDRSHYERFVAYHESFYRSVEATSVTPFSPRALDRGLAGVTVSLARLGYSKLTAPPKAFDILVYRKELDFVVEAIARRAEEHRQMDAAEAEQLRSSTRNRVVELLDAWEHLAALRQALQYSDENKSGPPLLYDPLDDDLANQPALAKKFKAGRSLRDVEPTVNLWVRNPYNQEIEEE
jgi:Helicase conserved C-terminal domain